eukprot:SM000016S01925  [mRNA]  locus=s16:616230:629684:+ [translate_table: standard]
MASSACTMALQCPPLPLPMAAGLAGRRPPRAVVIAGQPQATRDAGEGTEGPACSSHGSSMKAAPRLGDAPAPSSQPALIHQQPRRPDHHGVHEGPALESTPRAMSILDALGSICMPIAAAACVYAATVGPAASSAPSVLSNQGPQIDTQLLPPIPTKFPPLPDVKLPPYQKLVLSNGLRVLLLEDHELGLVGGQLLVKGGSKSEPAAQVGLAAITSSVQRSGGTRQHSADYLDLRLETLAARIEASAGVAEASVGFRCLTEDLGEVMGLFSEGWMYLWVVVAVVQQPLFPVEKLELVRSQVLGGIARRNDEPGTIARREMPKLLYGSESPYARRPEISTVSAIKISDLACLHKSEFRPDQAVLGIWGDFSSATVIKLVEDKFGDWLSAPSCSSIKPVLTPMEKGFSARPPGVYLIDRPGLTQGYVRMGELGTTLDDPDLFRLDVLNSALNGFGGLLFDQVRSREGLAYSVFGGWSPALEHRGVFVAGAETQVKEVANCVKSMRKVLQGVTTELIKPEELSLAKQSALNSFVFNFADTGSQLGRIMTYELFEVDQDFLFKYRREVEKVTSRDILQAARRHLHPAEEPILVVSDAAQVEESLASLGLSVIPLDISIRHCLVKVYFRGAGLRKVQNAIRRGRSLKCSRCGRSGATMGCRIDRCIRSYHLPCARSDGCHFDHDEYLVACAEHSPFFQPQSRGALVRLTSRKERKRRLAALVAERRIAAAQALAKDVEEEEEGEKGDEDDFLRRERRRLLRDLARLTPIRLGDLGKTPSIVGQDVQLEHWKSVAGLQHVIQCMKEMVILPLRYPGVFEKLGILPPRGVLLHGHPGTGKTLVARALAGACAQGNHKVAYFARKGADCLGKYVGDAERQLRLLFQMAEACQPSVIFFDEIDGLAPKRPKAEDTGSVYDFGTERIDDIWGINDTHFDISMHSPCTGEMQAGSLPNVMPSTGFHALISGSGCVGQHLVAAAVIQALDWIAPAHMLSIPTMVLEGGGDVALGLSNIIAEGLRSQSCLLHLPRIDTWATQRIPVGEKLCSKSVDDHSIQPRELANDSGRDEMIATSDIPAAKLPPEICDYFNNKATAGILSDIQSPIAASEEACLERARQEQIKCSCLSELLEPPTVDGALNMSSLWRVAAEAKKEARATAQQDAQQAGDVDWEGHLNGKAEAMNTEVMPCEGESKKQGNEANRKRRRSLAGAVGAAAHDLPDSPAAQSGSSWLWGTFQKKPRGSHSRKTQAGGPQAASHAGLNAQDGEEGRQLKHAETYQPPQSILGISHATGAGDCFERSHSEDMAKAGSEVQEKKIITSVRGAGHVPTKVVGETALQAALKWCGMQLLKNAKLRQLRRVSRKLEASVLSHGMPSLNLLKTSSKRTSPAERIRADGPLQTDATAACVPHATPLSEHSQMRILTLKSQLDEALPARSQTSTDVDKASTDNHKHHLTGKRPGVKGLALVGLFAYRGLMTRPSELAEAVGMVTKTVRAWATAGACQREGTWGEVKYLQLAAQAAELDDSVASWVHSMHSLESGAVMEGRHSM